MEACAIISCSLCSYSGAFAPVTPLLAAPWGRLYDPLKKLSCDWVIWTSFLKSDALKKFLFFCHICVSEIFSYLAWKHTVSDTWTGIWTQSSKSWLSILLLILKKASFGKFIDSVYWYIWALKLEYWVKKLVTLVCPHVLFSSVNKGLLGCPIIRRVWSFKLLLLAWKTYLNQSSNSQCSSALLPIV